MPPSSEIVVTLPAALHARPAGAVVRTAARFDAAVELCHGERTANARSVLALMGLGADAGAELAVRATGPDAEAALTAVAEVLTTAE